MKRLIIYLCLSLPLLSQTTYKMGDTAFVAASRLDGFTVGGFFGKTLVAIGPYNGDSVVRFNGNFTSFTVNVFDGSGSQSGSPGLVVLEDGVQLGSTYPTPNDNTWSDSPSFTTNQTGQHTYSLLMANKFMGVNSTYISAITVTGGTGLGSQPAAKLNLGFCGDSQTVYNASTFTDDRLGDPWILAQSLGTMDQRYGISGIQVSNFGSPAAGYLANPAAGCGTTGFSPSPKYFQLNGGVNDLIMNATLGSPGIACTMATFECDYYNMIGNVWTAYPSITKVISRGILPMCYGTFPVLNPNIPTYNTAIQAAVSQWNTDNPTKPVVLMDPTGWFNGCTGTEADHLHPTSTSYAAIGAQEITFYNSLTPGALTISGPAFCNQGATCSYTASGGTAPYTFSMVSGSAGSITSGGGYSAPSKVNPQNQSHGCQVGPNNSIYNTRIDSAPVDTRANTQMGGSTNNAVWTATILPNVVAFLPSFFIDRTSVSTDPTTAFNFFYTAAHDGNYVIPTDARVLSESGTQLWQSSTTVDVHYINVIHDICNNLELYQKYPVGYKTSPNGANNSQSGQLIDLRTFLQDQGVDQAGLQLLPLTLNFDELQKVKDGVSAINHALRVSFGSLNCNFSQWPAGQGGAPYPFNTVLPVCGSRMRLKSAFMPSRMFDSFCSTTACHNIYDALVAQMKTYGFIVADTGTNWQVQAELGYTDPDVFGALTDIETVAGISLGTATNWEFVNESACQTNAAGTGLDINWMETLNTCSWQTPTNYAVVKVTDSASATATLSVGLMGTTIGCDLNTQVWIAGSAPAQINCWVNGNSNTAITYSLSPSGGSNGTITSGGIYTPPASVGSKTITTITATSAGDGTVATTQAVTILPSAPIRINVGDTADYTDGNSHLWYADQKTGDPNMFITGFNSLNNLNGNPWTNTNGASGLYNFQVYGSYAQGDLKYSLHVPNGTYQVNLLQTANQATDYAALSVDAGGVQAVVAKYDVFTSASSTQFRAFTTTFTQTVIGGILEFILRWQPIGTPISDPGYTIPIYTNPGVSPGLAAFEIDTSPPGSVSGGKQVFGAGQISH